MHGAHKNMENRSGFVENDRKRLILYEQWYILFCMGRITSRFYFWLEMQYVSEVFTTEAVVMDWYLLWAVRNVL